MRRIAGFLAPLAAAARADSIRGGSLVAASLLAASAALAEPYAPRVGQPHEDFTLPRIDNRAPVSLRMFRGQKVLLIHFASW